MGPQTNYQNFRPNTFAGNPERYNCHNEPTVVSNRVTSWNGTMWNRYEFPSALDDEEQQVYTTLPEVILSANKEIGRKESSIPVMMQRACASKALPSTVADIRCTELGVDGMLQKLNIDAASVCTRPDSPLYKACKYFIAKNYDLGTAYAHLRHHLYDFNTNIHVVKAQNKDKRMRRNLLRNKRITDGDAPPRRVWDLVANRVVPWWVARKDPWAISHAWMDDIDLKREMTPINGYEWPVPMPKDADLNLIRIEMLNLGAEYIWLDVLCLRQKGEGDDSRRSRSQEVLRKEEWKVDLPTIGWIYHKAKRVVCYFSGLGLPLSFKPGDFGSDRCWFNRAWTLQETRNDLVVAGKTNIEIDSIGQDFQHLIFPAKIINDDRIEEKFMTKRMQELFDEKLASLRQMGKEASVFHVLSQMQNRKSTNPVDKIAGLVYLLYSEYIPIYDFDQPEEDAWTELVKLTQNWFRVDLFFLYPAPGNGSKFWCPSWAQLMRSGEVLPKASLNAKYHLSVRVTGSLEQDNGFLRRHEREVGGYRGHCKSSREAFYWSKASDAAKRLSEAYSTPRVQKSDNGLDSYHGPCIDSCTVRGLADNSTSGMPRHGTLDVTDASEKKHTFEIVTNHTFPIPDDNYTIIGIKGEIYEGSGNFWVVGKLEGPEGKFRKVSVISMTDEDDNWEILSFDIHRTTIIYLL